MLPPLLQPWICGQGLYSHFFEQGHKGLEDLRIHIIDVTDINKHNEGESFWIEKLMTYCPRILESLGNTMATATASADQQYH